MSFLAASSLAALVLLAGCDPQDAEISGQYAIFLAADTSDTIDRLTKVEKVNLTEKATDLGLAPIDCRDLSSLTAEELADTRIEGYDFEANCCAESLDDDTANDPDGDYLTPDDCTAVVPTWFTWLDDYSYYKLDKKFSPGGDAEAWRTEAVITSEGDFQLTAHIDMPGIGDFRFGWVIDPTFQPKECVEGESGAELRDFEGEWLTNWSAREADGGTLWFLNAGSYQLNPSSQGEAWYVTEDWSAGYSFSRFEDEEFFHRATDYQDHSTDNDELGTPLYYHSYENFRGDPEHLPYGPDYDSWVTNIDEYLNGVDGVGGNTDLAMLGGSDLPVTFKLESNNWRTDTTPGSPNGYYDWVGVSTSWVLIDNPQDIAINNEKPVTGSFQIFLEGVAAPSKTMVQGNFTINKIREDVWGHGTTLEELKKEENNTPDCGEYRLTTDEPAE